MILVTSTDMFLLIFSLFATCCLSFCFVHVPHHTHDNYSVYLQLHLHTHLSIPNTSNHTLSALFPCHNSQNSSQMFEVIHLVQFTSNNFFTTSLLLLHLTEVPVSCARSSATLCHLLSIFSFSDKLVLAFTAHSKNVVDILSFILVPISSGTFLCFSKHPVISTSFSLHRITHGNTVESGYVSHVNCQFTAIGIVIYFVCT